MKWTSVTSELLTIEDSLVTEMEYDKVGASVN
jgi:hypothetical protein